MEDYKLKNLFYKKCSWRKDSIYSKQGSKIFVEKFSCKNDYFEG
jgi:hypothetical protein